MPLQYASAYGVLALVLSGTAWLGQDELGVAGAFVFFYGAFSLVWVAAAYVGGGPRLLFKRADGRRMMVGWLILAPYFLINSGLLALYRRLSRQPALVQVLPRLWFGRRLTDREALTVQWAGVLDLAAEFASTATAAAYRSLPVLDGLAPDLNELQTAVQWIAEVSAAGPVYVHCALGHGRSACVVAAYLLWAGVVGSAVEGVRLLRKLRAGVRLSVSQRQLLRRFETSLARPSCSDVCTHGD